MSLRHFSLASALRLIPSVVVCIQSDNKSTQHRAAPRLVRVPVDLVGGRCWHYGWGTLSDPLFWQNPALQNLENAKFHIFGLRTLQLHLFPIILCAKITYASSLIDWYRYHRVLRDLACILNKSSVGRPPPVPVGPAARSGNFFCFLSPKKSQFLQFLLIETGDTLRANRAPMGPFSGRVSTFFTLFQVRWGPRISVGGGAILAGCGFGGVKLNIPPDFRAHRAGSRSRGVLVALCRKEWVV